MTEMITHEMPTSEQRRDSIRDKIAKGEPLGASHVPNINGDVMTNCSVIGYSTLSGACECGEPSSRCQWPACGRIGRDL